MFQSTRRRWCQGILLTLLLVAPFSLRAQQPAPQSDKQASQLKSEFIAPGIEHIQIIRGYKSEDETTGPWLINILRFDPRRARLQMVHALDEGVGLETTSSLATRYAALAAVNGGYFLTTGTYRGDSLGVQMLNGTLISEPHYVRAAAGLIERQRMQELIFGHLKLDSQVITSGRVKHIIDGLNRQRADNELILFTPNFHRTTLTDPNGIEVVVRRGRVVASRDRKGSSVIPADGYVISAAGPARDWAFRHLTAGTRVELKLNLSPTESEMRARWRQASNIIGGGPQLIRNGRIEITNDAETILPSFVSDLHPRTAIAKLKSGQILLVTVDGRQAESVGMSLTALAHLLLEFDATDAINLDGGGSTSMVIRNQLVNKPSDATGERPVSDAILVFPR